MINSIIRISILDSFDNYLCVSAPVLDQEKRLIYALNSKGVLSEFNLYIFNCSLELDPINIENFLKNDAIKFYFEFHGLKIPKGFINDNSNSSQK